MDRRIEKIADFIKRNYQQKLSLDNLSSKVKLSTFYFQRLFKKEMNETPNVFINRVRLEKAAHLLKAGINYNISEIADECGFSSAAVFNRSFKEFYNISPVLFSKLPSTLFVANKKNENIKSLGVEVIFLPDIYIYGVATSITNKQLMDKIEQAEDFCKNKGIDVGGRTIGVLTHNTVHHPEAKNNYYLGISVDALGAKNFSEQLFFISKGKYASFNTNESILNLREILMQFKIRWLDSSPYKWRDLIAYEEFLPGTKNSNYPFLNRRIYVPLQLK